MASARPSAMIRLSVPVSSLGINEPVATGSATAKARTVAMLPARGLRTLLTWTAPPEGVPAGSP